MPKISHYCQTRNPSYSRTSYLCWKLSWKRGNSIIRRRSTRWTQSTEDTSTCFIVSRSWDPSIHFQSRTIPLSGSSPSSLCAKAFVALKDATPSFSSLILDGERLYQCYTLSGIQRWNRNRSLTFAGVLPMKVTSLTSILLVVPPWVVSF